MAGKHRASKGGSHRKPEMWIVKYKTEDGETKQDGSRFDSEEEAVGHSIDVEGMTGVVKAWAEKEK